MRRISDIQNSQLWYWTLYYVYTVSQGFAETIKQQKSNNILYPAVLPDYLNRNKAHRFQTKRSLISTKTHGTRLLYFTPVLWCVLR